MHEVTPSLNFVVFMKLGVLHMCNVNEWRWGEDTLHTWKNEHHYIWRFWHAKTRFLGWLGGSNHPMKTKDLTHHITFPAIFPFPAALNNTTLIPNLSFTFTHTHTKGKKKPRRYDCWKTNRIRIENIKRNEELLASLNIKSKLSDLSASSKRHRFLIFLFLFIYFNHSFIISSKKYRI